jgi:hypothetical protein
MQCWWIFDFETDYMWSFYFHFNICYFTKTIVTPIFKIVLIVNHLATLMNQYLLLHQKKNEVTRAHFTK